MSDSLRPYGLSLPDSSVHGILQARVLEWVAIPFSRGSSQSRDRTWVSCIAGRFFPSRATRKPTPLIHSSTNSDEDKNDTKIITYYKQYRASLVAQMVKHPLDHKESNTTSHTQKTQTINNIRDHFLKQNRASENKIQQNYYHTGFKGTSTKF